MEHGLSNGEKNLVGNDNKGNKSNDKKYKKSKKILQSNLNTLTNTSNIAIMLI